MRETIERHEDGEGPVEGSAWWRTGVIYEIAVASFADSNGDGTGDLRGIIEKLDYLNDGTPASLGVDAIWLTPINASPMSDFGYDVSDYRAINPRFGTMDDFEELLDACHERGMRVMMDLVLNHTSNEHPWFVESRGSRANPKRDWYVWADGKSPGKPPNNWVAVAEGSAWERDETTGQYYYHAFLPFQPDLNWHNPDVRREMLGVAEFWLDKGVDGFRLDLINFLHEDPSLRDNPPRLGRRPYFWQEHLYDRSRPESLEVARDLRRLTDGYPARALMGEVCTDKPDDAIAYLGSCGDALHLSFYLDFALRAWNAGEFAASVGWLEEHLPPGGWPCYYLDNHDLPRSHTRLGRGGDASARAKVAAAMLLTLRGTPLVYYGEELGMPTSRVSRSVMDDPIGRRYWPLSNGRDGSRTPMQWSASEGAGFTSGTPWLPVDRSHATANVLHQDTDPASLLNWYRRLIWLRRARPALQVGDYRAIEGAPRGIFAYVREAEGEMIAVLLNFTSRRLALGATGDELARRRVTTLLSTHAGDAQESALSEISLAGDEALVLDVLP